jgi:hypothetical protein
LGSRWGMMRCRSNSAVVAFTISLYM